MKVTALLVFGLFISSCQAQELNCVEIKELLSDEVETELFCNKQEFEIGNSGYLLFSSFVKNLFCNSGCFTPASAMEDYFGWAVLGNNSVDYSIMPSVLEFHELINRKERDEYYSRGLEFYFQCFNGDELILNSCFIYNVFFMIEKDVRGDGEISQRNLSSLISIYEFYFPFNTLLSDMVLNTIRRYNMDEISEFLLDKKFKSQFFNSDEAIELHKEINDSSYETFVSSN